MMECIEELKKIGIQNINSKTKITIKRLNDICEYKFDEIDRARVKGFIYILQREYKIDMSEWLKAYDEYHKENEEVKDVNEEVKISFIDTTIKNKTYIRLVSIFVILLTLFIAYFIYNNSTTQNKEISEEVNINDNNNSNISDNVNYDANIIDNNSMILNQDENIISDADNNDANEIADDNKTIENKNIIFDTEKVVITPKSPLWVGIIDLQTYKKKQVSISEDFNIELDDSKIIRTGHGYFNITSSQLNKKYIGGDSKYFVYIKNDGFKEISKEKFLELNRGQEW